MAAPAPTCCTAARAPICSLSNPPHTPNEGVFYDHIMDFSSAEGDKISLSRIDANSIAAGNQAFTYIGAGAFTGVAGQLKYVGGFIQGDTNGDRAADFMIECNAFNLSASDFYL